MSDTPPPALSDVALRETLDLLGRVVASMSARLDRQGEQIEALSFGEERAAAQGSGEAVWAQNRRAEIKDR